MLLFLSCRLPCISPAGKRFKVDIEMLTGYALIKVVADLV